MEGCGGGGGEGGFVWVMRRKRRGGVVHCEVLGCIIDFCFCFLVFLGSVEGWDRFWDKGERRLGLVLLRVYSLLSPFCWWAQSVLVRVVLFLRSRKHGLSLPLERIFCSFLHMEAVPTKACCTENS